MNSGKHDDVLEVLADFTRKQLTDGDSVRVPSLGTFDVEHRPSEMKKDEDGSIVMIPPQDVVRFTPDV